MAVCISRVLYSLMMRSCCYIIVMDANFVLIIVIVRRASRLD